MQHTYIRATTYTRMGEPRIRVSMWVNVCRHISSALRARATERETDRHDTNDKRQIFLHPHISEKWRTFAAFAAASAATAVDAVNCDTTSLPLPRDASINFSFSFRTCSSRVSIHDDNESSSSLCRLCCRFYIHRSIWHEENMRETYASNVHTNHTRIFVRLSRSFALCVC